MSKRGKPKLGPSGIWVPGTDRTDGEVRAIAHLSAEASAEARGLLFDDEQFSALADHLPNLAGGDREEVRRRLDFIRGFYLRSLLHRAKTPARADRNATLQLLVSALRAFLQHAETRIQPPEWLSEKREAACIWPSHAFIDLPANLASFALAPQIRTTSSDLAEGAERAACLLKYLDDVSQNEVMRHLPWRSDYASATWADLRRTLRMVEEAAASALAEAKERRGRESFPARIQAVAWLADLWKSQGVPVTHCPALKTIYDGEPHSAGGRFIMAFFRIVHPRLSPSTVSGAIKEVIAHRHRYPQATAAGA